MHQTSQAALAEYFEAHQKVVSDSLASLSPAIAASADALAGALVAGSKVIAFGNGGSATQASHFVGELLGRFKENRRPLPAIALGSDPAAVTCIANDFGYEALFERQVEALVMAGDVAVGLTTSGRSANVLRGLAAAKKKGAVTIALTGENGLVRGEADHTVSVPSGVTAHVQEVHGIVIHCWCAALDGLFH